MARDIKVLGGQMSFKYLTSLLPEKDYAVYKIRCWLNMYNDNARAKKWLKPNTKGTKVNFDAINTKEQDKEAFKELEDYISEVNEKYGLHIKLEQEEKA